MSNLKEFVRIIGIRIPNPSTLRRGARCAAAVAVISGASLTACGTKTKAAASTTTVPTTVAVPSSTIPATTVAPTVSQQLGARLITPAGFALSTSTDVTNGPIDPATFDQDTGISMGASATGYVGGYSDTWDQISGNDYVEAIVFQFQTTAQAKTIMSALVDADKASEANVSSTGFGAIPGAVAVNFNTASDGTYDHDIVATKGNRVLAMTYVSSDINAVNRIGALAAQQYRAL